MLLADPPGSNVESSGDFVANLRAGDAGAIGNGPARSLGRGRKDGTTFPMDLAIGDIPPQAGIREFIGTVRDITERVAFEAEIRRSQALLQATFDASPLSIVIKNTELKTLFWNRAAEQIAGYGAEEAKAPDAFRDPRFHELAMQSVLSGPIRGIEEERRRKDGSVFRLRGTVAPIRVDGKMIGFVGMFEDVTASTAIERQLVQAQKMEAIGNLSGGMAHDFNNLLGIIIGNLDLQLRDLPTDSEAAELARESLDAALRGADLTRRLLAFARQQSLQPRLVDLNTLVDEIITLLRRTLSGRIEISLTVAPDVWPVDGRSRSQLQASHHQSGDQCTRRDAARRPTQHRHRQPTPRRRLCRAASRRRCPAIMRMIEVSDTGVGMEPELLSQDFRAVLHHQGPRARHRPRPQHGFRFHQAIRRAYQRLQRARRRHDLPPLSLARPLPAPRQRRARWPQGCQFGAATKPCSAVEDNAVLAPRRGATAQCPSAIACSRASDVAAALAISETRTASICCSPISSCAGDIVMASPWPKTVRARCLKMKVVLTSGFPGSALYPRSRRRPRASRSSASPIAATIWRGRCATRWIRKSPHTLSAAIR